MRGKGDASGDWQRQRRLVAFLFSISVHLISGLAVDPSSPKDGAKTASPSNSKSKTGLEVLYIILGVVTIVLLAVFLFKMWQKKKREEQHARLLRLFEEDDELELELGLRD